MGSYDEEMASDKAAVALEKELETAKPSTYNRFKVDVGHIVYKCTFGKYGAQKQTATTGDCPFTPKI